MRSPLSAPMRAGSLLASILIGFLVTAPVALAADSFRLGPDDRVDVRVFNRPDLSLNLKVDGDGNLRLPLLGSVSAAGQTIDEVEARLTVACRDIAGILGPRVTVTVVETAPVFVGGVVQNPGRYAWASDLTPAKAYALAGGPPRLAEGGAMLAYEAYRAIEQDEQTSTRLAAVILRRARLVAEAASAGSFDLPGDWATGLKPAQAADLLARERQLFATRRETLAGELNNLKRQSQILADQETGYRVNLDKKGQQHALLQQELAAISGNTEIERLVPVTRLLSLKRLIIDAENDQRDIERRIGETKLQRTIADQTMANLQNARVMEVSAQLAEIERELVALRDSLDPVRRRAELGRRALGESSFAGKSGRSLILSFRIRREFEGRVQVIEADADTKLQPRDLVEIAVESLSQGPSKYEALSQAEASPVPSARNEPVPFVPVVPPASPVATVAILPAPPAPSKVPSPRLERRKAVR